MRIFEKIVGEQLNINIFTNNINTFRFETIFIGVLNGIYIFNSKFFLNIKNKKKL